MKVKTIKATSRCSVKVKDNFYTIEYTEERGIDELDDVKEERKKLWDKVNSEVDTQIEEIFNTFK